jgi:acetoin utilization protein AcuB
MSNLLSKLKVKEVMTKKVLHITEDTLVEDAARILVDNNIGGLPVMKNENLIGIVTESDLFKLFIELFGTRKKGIRAAILIPEKRGELAGIAKAIAECGGNIISIGTFPGNDPTNALCTIKVDEISSDAFTAAIEPFVTELLDIREV